MYKHVSPQRVLLNGFFLFYFHRSFALVISVSCYLYAAPGKSPKANITVFIKDNSPKSPRDDHPEQQWFPINAGMTKSRWGVQFFPSQY